MSALDHIDDVLADRCVCGCGASLGSSPSAWYASDECQRRHLSSRATDADEVYRGQDADLDVPDCPTPSVVTGYFVQIPTGGDVESELGHLPAEIARQILAFYHEQHMEATHGPLRIWLPLP